MPASENLRKSCLVADTTIYLGLPEAAKTSPLESRLPKFASGFNRFTHFGWREAVAPPEGAVEAADHNERF
jgi:hypothetical protein